MNEIEHKFKVGDKVFVHECTDDIDEMKEKIGTVCTIDELTHGRWCGTIWSAYRLKEDGGTWYWREDWLDPVTGYLPEDAEVEEEDLMSVFKE